MKKGASIGASILKVLTRNWREKLLALVLAFLFWYLVRSQAVVRSGYLYEPPTFPGRGQL
jgi:hypothetical protein